MTTISKQVRKEIKAFIRANIKDWRVDAREYEFIELTIAVSGDGYLWSYQTGDNSYTGGAYGLPIWGVTSVYPESTIRDVFEEVTDQIEEQLGST